jgi:CBS domain-containing protein
MFFVLVGARLGFKNMPNWLWAIVAAYVIFRSTGKMFGCFMGARLSNADKVVQKYSGLGIFAQGGVAIGLSIMASNHLNDIFIVDNTALGDVIIAGVTASTFIVQIIGPPLTKLSIKLAKENDKNITEEDIMEKMTAGQAAIRDIVPLKENDNIKNILKRFSSENNLAYPVVDENSQYSGLLTLSNLKDVLSNTDFWDWIVADDMMVSDIHTIAESTPLKNGIRLLTENNFDQIPVISDTGNIPVGILDLTYVNKFLKRELIKVQTSQPYE